MKRIARTGATIYKHACALGCEGIVSKRLGSPYRAGRSNHWLKIKKVTESTHFANAALWAATDQRCGNEAFNITNGDYFRWRNLWPKIAAVFEMAVADPQTICLTQHMADKGVFWDGITTKYKLKRVPTWISSLGHLRITFLALTGM